MREINPFSAAWTIFWVVWLVAALRTKRTQERAPLGSRLAYTIPVLLGAYLMFLRESELGRLSIQVIPRSRTAEYVGLSLTIAGIALAIWARFYIGQNWSGTVTVKVGHELIRTGPYHFVRHPIYSGILLAIIGSALARGDAVGVIAIALFWFGFLIKSRKEEEFMRKTFGEQYVQYAQTTGALVPKLRF